MVGIGGIDLAAAMNLRLCFRDFYVRLCSRPCPVTSVTQ